MGARRRRRQGDEPARRHRSKAGLAVLPFAVRRACRCCGPARGGEISIEVARAAIAGQHVGHALLDRAIIAMPRHRAGNAAIAASTSRITRVTMSRNIGLATRKTTWKRIAARSRWADTSAKNVRICWSVIFVTITFDLASFPTFTHVHPGPNETIHRPRVSRELLLAGLFYTPPLLAAPARLSGIARAAPLRRPWRP